MFDWLQNLLKICSNGNEEFDSNKNETLTSLYAIMIEIAKADKDFSAEEADKIDYFMKRFAREEVEDLNLIRQKAEQSLKNSNDLYNYTKAIRQNCNVDERVQILELFWQLVYTDGYLDPYEEQLMRRLCDLIGLQTKHYMNSKKHVLENLNKSGEAKPD